jgi:hypothetical protein
VKKIITTIFFTGLLMGIFSCPAWASDGWEASITVTSGNAESRLSFGQKPEATDLTDGLYDLPAMLSGAIQVYFQTDGESFWRDIRAMGPDREWQLLITSQTGQPITITWDPENLPADANVRLIDPANDRGTNMKTTGSYIIENTGNASLILEVTGN